MSDKPAMFEVRTGQCDTCRWRDPDAPSMCRAFPDGIDILIIGDVIAHDRPLLGDHGHQHRPPPADTTDGPVTYLLVGHGLEHDGRIQGAVWASDDGSGGFLPASWLPDDARRRWELQMRRAWAAGVEPDDAVVALADAATSSTYAVVLGPRRELGGTATLATHLST